MGIGGRWVIQFERPPTGAAARVASCAGPFSAPGLGLFVIGLYAENRTADVNRAVMEQLGLGTRLAYHVPRIRTSARSPRVSCNKPSEWPGERPRPSLGPAGTSRSGLAFGCRSRGIRRVRRSGERAETGGGHGSVSQWRAWATAYARGTSCGGTSIRARIGRGVGA